MITTKQYNKLSKEDIPVLKRGEVAIYVNAKNTVVDGVSKFPRIYLPNKDTINNPSGDGVIDIAYITGDAPDGQEPRFGEIIFEPADKGIIVCSGDNVLDQRKFAYLELSNHNESNENRDTTKEVYFSRRVPGQAAENALDKARKEAQALNFAESTPIEKLRELLSERKPVEHLNESDLRLLAMEEYKNKPFGGATKMAQPAPVAVAAVTEGPKPHEALNLGNIASMFDAEVLKWSVAESCLVNTENQGKYKVKGMMQVDKLEAKQKKLLEACFVDPEMGARMTADIKSALA